MRLIDLTGQKFGRLTVKRRVENEMIPSGRKTPHWYCNCDCGAEDVIVEGSHLKNGRTKSCGCLQKELAKERQRLKNKNTYYLTNDFGIGYTNKKEEFYFDIEDYDKIKDYCWRLRKDGYLDAKLLDGSGKRILMHNLILGKKYIDHINHIRHDNRKSNLRESSKDHSFDTHNQMNKSIQSNNTSGVVGVSWHKKQKAWNAYISIDNKRISLGSFENFEDAVNARKNAEERYFGEWSYKNSIKHSA